VAIDDAPQGTGFTSQKPLSGSDRNKKIIGGIANGGYLIPAIIIIQNKGLIASIDKLLKNVTCRPGEIIGAALNKLDKPDWLCFVD
jgi:hypothetical protein